MSNDYVLYDRKGKVIKEDYVSEETIKERIDRETKEQMNAGRGYATGGVVSPPPAEGSTAVIDPDRRYIEHEFERAVRELTPLVATNWNDLFLLCDLRGRPVAESKRTDYHFIRYQILDWLKEWTREDNWALLHPEQGDINSLVSEAKPVPEYARGFNDGNLAARLEALRGQAGMGAMLAQPGPYTSLALEDITKVLGARGHSYTVTNEFENFEQQAGDEQPMRMVFRGALRQKLAREKSCAARLEELGWHPDDGDPSPEELALVDRWLDSIRDVCGYALLFFGWSKRYVETGA